MIENFTENLLTPEQQAKILDAVVKESGYTRVYMSILTNRADDAPSRRDKRALDEAARQVISWILEHHVAVALYELMLNERVLLDVGEKGGLYFTIVDLPEEASPDDAERRLGELIVEQLVEHFHEEREEYAPIPSDTFIQVQAAIQQRHAALGRTENLAPKARRDSDATPDADPPQAG